MSEKKYNDITTKDKSPTFEEMVFLIEKNFKDYLEQSQAFTSDEIEQGWQRYKTINHLYRDESPAEQPVADNELKQEIDHLEKKISLCEDALEKLHAERYETRLAMRMLLKVFLNSHKSGHQAKYYAQAEAIFKKYHGVSDVLRSEDISLVSAVHCAEAPEQPVREVDDAIKFLEWAYQNRWFSKEGDLWCYTFEQGTRVSDATYKKNYMKTTDQLYALFKQQKPGSGEKEVKP